MKIGIVGWGVEGQSVYRYFGPEHRYLIASEEPREDFPPASDKVRIQALGGSRAPGLTGKVDDLSYLKGLENCDKVIYSVTAYPNLRQVYGQDKTFWDKATTVVHIFFESTKTKNVVGVTGTKGKGTTSTLIARMLEASGKKVHLGGNIGQSVLDFVKEVQPDDWVVLELSSFQLYRLPYSPHIAVCLMVVAEHLDWHSDVEEYIQAKANIFKHQQPDDIAVYYADNENSVRIAGYSPGKKIPYYQKPGGTVRGDGTIVVGEEETEVVKLSQVKLLGEHNLQNVCAALTAVWQVSQDVQALKAAITSFRGLEHRLEFVGEIKGVSYYDDSFSTTPETAVVALRSFTKPKVMILGGSDKGSDYSSLVEAIVKDDTRWVITVGITGPKIARALQAKGFKSITAGLEKMYDIVSEAKKRSQPGDVVLLSPASASFGLFKDYKDRGNQFKQAVQELA